ncbi:MAG: DUF4345 domain-containing protein [Pseudomonadales bacterium]
MNNKLELTQRCVLLLAGALLLMVSASILISPIGFYAANNIELGSNTSLISELKAPAGFLLLAGGFMISSLFVRRYQDTATCLAAVIYLSYALSRVISMGVDGVPSSGLVQAAIIEAVLGICCVVILATHQLLARKS